MNKKLIIIGFFTIVLFSCKKDQNNIPTSVITGKKQNSSELSSIHTCSARSYSLENEGPSTSAVGKKVNFWNNNSKGPIVLHVKFLDDLASDFIRSKIQEKAKKWEKYANFRIDFVGADQPAEIRITCDSTSGSWSYVGKENLSIPSNEATMNYGWFTDATEDSEFSRVVVHEFGHALGLEHEQSSPLSNIKWNKPYVYAYYQRTNGWSHEMVDQNVFYKLSTSGTVYSAYDTKSIMHYPVPKEFTLDGRTVGWNTDLSAADKSFINKIYPFPKKG
ncbi:MAG: M12 family metallopeptidase [Sphingobacteriaceae bacterium]|nr:MAG: peptidase M12 [Pedobacter sp.]